MRTCGGVREAGVLGRHDHVCVGFRAFAEVEATVAAFIVGGLAAGLRVELVSPASADDARALVLARVPGAAAQLARGALRVSALTDVYADGDVIVPERQVAAYAGATEQALADGFAGYRVVADVTGLAATPAQRSAFARYEHLVDRFMAGRPFSAMCLYDRTRLDAAALAELACLHPVHAPADAPFGLFATRDGLGLWGELDVFGLELLELALQRTCESAAGDAVPVDAAALRFLDHRSLLALDAHAAAREATLVLRGAPSAAGRVIELLGLRHVHLAQAA